MPVQNPPGSPVTSVPAPGSPISSTLPATTPQAFAIYLDDHFHGSDGQLGTPLTPLNGLGFTGATLGDQWMSFYAAAIAKSPGKTLRDYEDAFVVLAEEAYLGIDLAAAAGGGLAAGGSFAQSATVTAAQEAGSIFSVLQSGALWLRIAEGLLGIVLIAVGVAKLTGAVPIATKIASVVK